MASLAIWIIVISISTLFPPVSSSSSSTAVDVSLSGPFSVSVADAFAISVSYTCTPACDDDLVSIAWLVEFSPESGTAEDVTSYGVVSTDETMLSFADHTFTSVGLIVASVNVSLLNATSPSDVPPDGRGFSTLELQMLSCFSSMEVLTNTEVLRPPEVFAAEMEVAHDCGPEAQLAYSWALLPDVEALDVSQLIYRTMYLPALSLSAAESPYSLTAICCLASTEVCTEYYLSIDVVPSDVFAFIQNGNGTHNIQDDLILDSSSSFDPDGGNLRYQWRCEALSEQGSCPISSVSNGQPTLGMLDSTLSVGVFLFTVVISAESRTAVASIEIEVHTGGTTVEYIDSPTFLISTLEKLTIRAELLPGSTRSFGHVSGSWSVVPLSNDSHGPLDLSDRSVALTPAGFVMHLVIAPGSLSPGASYSVRVEVLDDTGSTYKNIRVLAAAEVITGHLDVSPQFGEALQSEFRLEASGFSDPSGLGLLEFRFAAYPPSGEVFLSGWDPLPSLWTVLPAGDPDLTVCAFARSAAGAEAAEPVCVNVVAWTPSVESGGLDAFVEQVLLSAWDLVWEEGGWDKDPVLTAAHAITATLLTDTDLESSSEAEASSGGGSAQGSAAHSSTDALGATTTPDSMSVGGNFTSEETVSTATVLVDTLRDVADQDRDVLGSVSQLGRHVRILLDVVESCDTATLAAVPENDKDNFLSSVLELVAIYSNSSTGSGLDETSAHALLLLTETTLLETSAPDMLYDTVEEILVAVSRSLAVDDVAGEHGTCVQTDSTILSQTVHTAQSFTFVSSAGHVLLSNCHLNGSDPDISVTLPDDLLEGLGVGQDDGVVLSLMQGSVAFSHMRTGLAVQAMVSDVVQLRVLDSPQGVWLDTPISFTPPISFASTGALQEELAALTADHSGAAVLGCVSWNSEAREWDSLRCASLPNPRPRSFSFEWDSHFHYLGSRNLAYAWNFSSPACEDDSPEPSVDGVMLRVLRSQPGEICIAADERSGCYWDVLSQSFVGPDCVYSVEDIECRCFDVSAYALALHGGVRHDMISAVDESPSYVPGLLVLLLLCLGQICVLMYARLWWGGMRSASVLRIYQPACGARLLGDSEAGGVMLWSLRLVRFPDGRVSGPGLELLRELGLSPCRVLEAVPQMEGPGERDWTFALSRVWGRTAGGVVTVGPVAGDGAAHDGCDLDEGLGSEDPFGATGRDYLRNRGASFMGTALVLATFAVKRMLDPDTIQEMINQTHAYFCDASPAAGPKGSSVPPPDLPLPQPAPKTAASSASASASVLSLSHDNLFRIAAQDPSALFASDKRHRLLSLFHQPLSPDRRPPAMLSIRQGKGGLVETAKSMRALARATSAGNDGESLNFRLFVEQLKLFILQLYSNPSPLGWMDRSAIWRFVFLQASDGFWVPSEDLLLALRIPQSCFDEMAAHHRAARSPQTFPQTEAFGGERTGVGGRPGRGQVDSLVDALPRGTVAPTDRMHDGVGDMCTSPALQAPASGTHVLFTGHALPTVCLASTDDGTGDKTLAMPAPGSLPPVVVSPTTSTVLLGSHAVDPTDALMPRHMQKDPSTGEKSEHTCVRASVRRLLSKRWLAIFHAAPSWLKASVPSSCSSRREGWATDSNSATACGLSSSGTPAGVSWEPLDGTVSLPMKAWCTALCVASLELSATGEWVIQHHPHVVTSSTLGVTWLSQTFGMDMARNILDAARQIVDTWHDARIKDSKRLARRSSWAACVRNPLFSHVTWQKDEGVRRVWSPGLRVYALCRAFCCIGTVLCVVLKFFSRARRDCCETLRDIWCADSIQHTLCPESVSTDDVDCGAVVNSYDETLECELVRVPASFSSTFAVVVLCFIVGVGVEVSLGKFSDAVYFTHVCDRWYHWRATRLLTLRGCLKRVIGCFFRMSAYVVPEPEDDAGSRDPQHILRTREFGIFSPRQLSFVLFVTLCGYYVMVSVLWVWLSGEVSLVAGDDDVNSIILLCCVCAGVAIAGMVNAQYVWPVFLLNVRRMWRFTTTCQTNVEADAWTEVECGHSERVFAPSASASLEDDFAETESAKGRISNAKKATLSS
eukprot:Rmarinus@m.277